MELAGEMDGMTDADLDAELERELAALGEISEAEIAAAHAEMDAAAAAEQNPYLYPSDAAPRGGVTSALSLGEAAEAAAAEAAAAEARRTREEAALAIAALQAIRVDEYEEPPAPDAPPPPQASLPPGSAARPPSAASASPAPLASTGQGGGDVAMSAPAPALLSAFIFGADGQDEDTAVAPAAAPACSPRRAPAEAGSPHARAARAHAAAAAAAADAGIAAAGTPGEEVAGDREAGATGGEDALARWSPSAEAGATWQAVLGGKAARERSWGLLRASIHAGREEAAAVVPVAQASLV